MKKKAFVLMHARVLLLFWERVGGCHPQEKHRHGEEALGTLMVFWVPRSSVFLEKTPDMLYGDISSRGTVKCGSAYMLVSSPAISTRRWVSQGPEAQKSPHHLHSWLWEVNELPTHLSTVKGKGYSSHPTDQIEPN